MDMVDMDMVDMVDMDRVNMDMVEMCMVDMDMVDMDRVDISKSRTFLAQFGLVSQVKWKGNTLFLQKMQHFLYFGDSIHRLTYGSSTAHFADILVDFEQSFSFRLFRIMQK